MTFKMKKVNKKRVKVIGYWFCSRCLQKLDVTKLEYWVDMPLSDVMRILESYGFKITCKACGNTTFIKKEFTIPVEDLAQKELDRQLKEYLSNNSNPTRRT